MVLTGRLCVMVRVLRVRPAKSVMVATAVPPCGSCTVNVPFVGLGNRAKLAAATDATPVAHCGGPCMVSSCAAHAVPHTLLTACDMTAVPALTPVTTPPDVIPAADAEDDHTPVALAVNGTVSPTQMVSGPVMDAGMGNDCTVTAIVIVSGAPPSVMRTLKVSVPV